MGKTMRSRVGKRRRGLNKTIPWLKFGLLIVILLFLILGLRGDFRQFSGETIARVPTTPMSKQVEVPDKIFRGSLAGKKLVALTFDDGPSAETTPRLLDILKEKKVIVTFFELGGRAQANPEITKRAFREGHEIGSHTMWHQNLVRVSRGEAEEDIASAKAVFREILGREVQLTRAPYGNTNAFISGKVGTPLVYWSVDTRDWESRDPDSIVQIALDNTVDGSIVLMHDIYDTTVDSVPKIIDGLRERGFEFVTVSELAKNRGEKLENGVTYLNFEP